MVSLPGLFPLLVIAVLSAVLRGGTFGVDFGERFGDLGEEPELLDFGEGLPLLYSGLEST